MSPKNKNTPNLSFINNISITHALTEQRGWVRKEMPHFLYQKAVSSCAEFVLIGKLSEKNCNALNNSLFYKWWKAASEVKCHLLMSKMTLGDGEKNLCGACKLYRPDGMSREDTQKPYSGQPMAGTHLLLTILPFYDSSSSSGWQKQSRKLKAARAHQRRTVSSTDSSTEFTISSTDSTKTSLVRPARRHHASVSWHPFNGTVSAHQSWSPLTSLPSLQGDI